MKRHFLASIGCAAMMATSACGERVEIGNGPGANGTGDRGGPSSDGPGESPAVLPTHPVVASVTDERLRPADPEKPLTGPQKRVDVQVVHWEDRAGFSSPPFRSEVFVTASDFPDRGACLPAVVGACRLATAPCNPGGASVAPPVVLTFSGGAFPTPMTLAPFGPNPSDPLLRYGDQDLWWAAAGESIVITSGATTATPSFSTSLPTPSKVTYAVPSAGAASTPLTLAWTVQGTASADVFFQLNRSAAGGGTAFPYAWCAAPASAGSLVVPAAVIAALGSGTHQVFTHALSETTKTVSGWDIVAKIANTPVGYASLTIP